MSELLKYLQQNNNSEYPFNYLYLSKTKLKIKNKEKVSACSMKHQTDEFQVKTFYKRISTIY